MTSVVVAGLPADVGETLGESYDAALRGLGDRIEIRVPDKRVSELLVHALEAGAEIVSVNPHRASLESAFLSTIEEESRSGDPGEGA